MFPIIVGLIDVPVIDYQIIFVIIDVPIIAGLIVVPIIDYQDNRYLNQCSDYR